MPSKLSCLIIGCGDVGSQLARQLVKQGVDVTGIRRDIDKLPARVKPWRLDLLNLPAALTWPQDFDYIVFCAAAHEASEQAYRAVYTEALGHILTSLDERAVAPKRFFFTSSTAVYAQDAGESVDEDSPCEPRRYNGQVMLEAENLLLASAIPSCILRLGGIYGPGRQRLLSMAQQGKGYDAGSALSNRIHRDDCASIIAHLIERNEAGMPVHERYLCVDSEPSPIDQICEYLAALSGTQITERGPAPIANKHCSNRRLVESGYGFIYPSYREGFSSLLK